MTSLHLLVTISQSSRSFLSVRLNEHISGVEVILLAIDGHDEALRQFAVPERITWRVGDGIQVYKGVVEGV